MKDTNIYTCENHLDEAFDYFLDENEVFPHLEKAKAETCSYCDCPAEYVLKVPIEKVFE